MISLEDLQIQIKNRRDAKRPRDQRMDFDHSLYLLIDPFQLNKESGLIRFTANEPQTIVDLGVSVIARNPLQPRIAMDYADPEDKREGIGQLERGIRGAFRDIDRRLNRRGLPPARHVAAWNLLLRGWMANRLVVKDEGHPIDFEPWDMRFTYPEFDRYGLASVIHESLTSWGDILRNYPGVAEQLQRRGDTGFYQEKLDMTVTQYEFWDREHTGLAVTSPTSRSQVRPLAPGNLVWAEEPYEHGILDEEDERTCPIVIVPAHGLPFESMPSVPGRVPILSPSDLYKGGGLPPWKRTGGWVAYQGRSFLSAVEDIVGEFNEMIATLWTIMDNDAYGTWWHTSRGGEQVEVALGGNAVNFGKTGDVLQRVGGMAASPDVYRLLEILSDQLKKGTADQQLLRGLMEFKGSGFLRAQMENAATTSLAPWISAYEFWASENAMCLMNQLRLNAGRMWTVWAEGSDRRLFKMEFGKDMVDEVVYVEMKSKPALPDDLAVRVNIAAQLANPARPLASIQTIFDKVLEWDDAQREKDLIFDDLADLDPMVVLLRLQTRMIARGLPEIAEIFGDKAFATAFVEKTMAAQMVQQAAAMGGGAGAGRPQEGVPGGMSPETMPPEQGGIEPGAQGVPPTPPGGAE